MLERRLDEKTETETCRFDTQKIDSHGKLHSRHGTHGGFKQPHRVPVKSRFIMQAVRLVLWPVGGSLKPLYDAQNGLDGQCVRDEERRTMSWRLMGMVEG